MTENEQKSMEGTALTLLGIHLAFLLTEDESVIYDTKSDGHDLLKDHPEIQSIVKEAAEKITDVILAELPEKADDSIEVSE